jgi:hypothetical protein
MSRVLEFVPPKPEPEDTRLVLNCVMSEPLRLDQFLPRLLEWQAYMGVYGAEVAEVAIEADVVVSPVSLTRRSKERRSAKAIIKAGSDKGVRLIRTDGLTVPAGEFFDMAMEAQAHVSLYREFVSYIRLHMTVAVRCPPDIESFVDYDD